MPIRLAELSTDRTNATRFRPGETQQSEDSLLGAAFRQENDMVALAGILSRDEKGYDPLFDFKRRSKESEAFRISPDSFANVRDEEDFVVMENKVMQEMRDRELLASSGIAGIAAGIAAGILSPTILLPGGAGVKGAGVLGTAGRVAGWTAVGAAAQEVVLYADQELRSEGEVALGIGTAAVLGGLLGAGIGYLSRDQIKNSQLLLEEMREEIVPYNPPSPVSLSAAANPGPKFDFETPIGKIEKGFGKFADNAIAALGPVTRVLNQDILPTARWVMAQLDMGGVKLEGSGWNAPARGGDIESRQKQWHGNYYRAFNAHKAAFKAREDRSLNFKQFSNEVGEALERGGDHPNADVKKAAETWRQQVFIPLLDQARQVGMPGFDEITEEQAERYLTRIIKRGIASREYDQLVEILEENSREKLTELYQRRMDTVTARAEADEQRAADITMSPEDRDALRAQLQADMKMLPSQFEPAVRQVAEEIRALRAQAKFGDGTRAEKAQLRKMANEMEAANKDLLADFTKAEKKIAGRFRSLDGHYTAVQEAQQKVLRTIEEVENAQLATLNRLIDQAQKLLVRIDKLSEDAIDEGLTKLQDQLEKALNVYDRAETRIDNLRPKNGIEQLVEDDLTPTEKISKAEAQQAARRERIEALKAKLEDAIDDRTARRVAIENVLEEAKQRTLATNNKRALRLEKLRQRAKDLDPNKVEEVAQGYLSKARDRRASFRDAALQAGVRFIDDKMNFDAIAKQNAEEVASKLLGEQNRAPGFTLLFERGPELARTLDIDPQRVWSNGKRYADFLERDIEKIGRRYVRTMSGDIELYRTFGTVQPLAKTKDQTYQAAAIQRIAEEHREAKRVASKIEDPKKREAELTKLDENWRTVRRDIQAVVDRIRYQRGVPDDPQAIGYRMGRIALNLNTLRMMGGVVLSSVPDLSRHIMKFGLVSTFRDGFVPLVSDFKNFKAMAEEVRYAGTALDVVLHGRSAAMFDIFDEVESGTLAERGLQTAANFMGRIALFDYWTAANKQFAGALANASISRNLDILTRSNASPKAIARAQRELASLGIDESLGKMILKEFTQTPGGSTRLDTGVWLPNTESWISDEARRAYRAAIARAVDDTIVTPGNERPLWIDGNMTGRLLGQFKSFTFSSTMKVMMAAAQDTRQGNMAPVLGSMFSLALGAMSYYTWAYTRGASTREEMLRNLEGVAGGDEDALRKLADEAITRSGLLGVLAEVHKFAERTSIPGTEIQLADYVTLSGAPTERSPFVQPFTDLFGPTFGDIPTQLDKIARGNGEQALKAGTRMTPFNNVTHFRLGIEAIAGEPIP